MVNPILPNVFGLLSHKVTVHHAIVPGNTQAADLTDSALWGNVKARIKMGDRIDIVADDYSFHAMLFVTHSGGAHLKTKLVYRVELDVVEGDYEEDPRFEIKMRGPKKWTVLSTDDGSIIQEMIPTRAAAYKWLDSHLKALAA